MTPPTWILVLKVDETIFRVSPDVLEVDCRLGPDVIRRDLDVTGILSGDHGQGRDAYLEEGVEVVIFREARPGLTVMTVPAQQVMLDLAGHVRVLGPGPRASSLREPRRPGVPLQETPPVHH